MDINTRIVNVCEKIMGNKEYFEKDIPIIMQSEDIEFNEIMEEYIMLSEEARASIQKKISVDNAWILLCFSENMATYSLRLKDQSYYTNGLAALSLIMNILDQREILIILPLYYDVYVKTGMQLTRALGTSEDLKDMVINFFNREDQHKSLKCMGYILEEHGNGDLCYKRKW